MSSIEICNFNKQDTQSVTMTISGTQIESKNQMHTLGVILDSKLQWAPQVSQAISKEKRHCMQLS